MRKLQANRLYIVIISSVLLFVIMSTVSLTSLDLLQGNARVVNYVGIVRGATQKLVKEELMGYPDDALVARLDGIINELLTGEGNESLVVLDDPTYLEYMGRVQESWNELKKDIYTVRNGGGEQELFDASQEYFELVNDTVFAAENYSESQVGRINGIMVAINVAFIALIVVVSVFVVRSIAVRRRADALGKIAYVDPLTKIANRASCEQRIAELTATPPQQKVTAFMFDMNDLKLTNDFLGHQGGDKIIVAFAGILAEAAAPYGFLGRYGGDEFIAIFEHDDEVTTNLFLSTVHEKVDEYNKTRSNKLEQIAYAAGYAAGYLGETDPEELIHAADNEMYKDKRRAKKGNLV